jgi:hypothetical protein
VRAAWLAEWAPTLGSSEVPMTPYRVIAEFMRTVNPREAIVTHDSGSPRDQLLPFYRAVSPRVDVMEDGQAVVAGGTASTDFPTTPGAFRTTPAGESDAFISKLSADGSSLEFSTFIGGSDKDAIRGMVLDGQGRACFAGQTRSPDFPVTPNAFQRTIHPALLDGMLGRLSADGSALEYATFVPGASNTQCLAVDPDGRACVGGGATDSYVTTPGAFQTSTGAEFVYKFDFDAGAFVYASKFGGFGIDFLEALAVDGAGAVYVVGTTSSFNFPTTPGAFDTWINGEDDAFVAKLSPDGSRLEYGTFFGGASFDLGFTITVDPAGRAYFAGRTISTNLPVTPDAFDPALSRGDGAYFAQLSADGSQLLYSTYFGGTTFWEYAEGIAIDSLGDVIIVGYTHAPDFPTTPGSLMPEYGPGLDTNHGFVLKFAFGPWSNLGHSLASSGALAPSLLGEGSLEAGSAGSIALSQAKPFAPAYLVVGLTRLDAPFKGGTMVPHPLLLLPLATDVSGGLLLSWAWWPPGLPAGTAMYMQYWIADAGGPAGLSASNGLQGTTP